MDKRPSFDSADIAVAAFLASVFGGDDLRPDFDLIEDGDDAWAFYVKPSDTTSYVHSDLTIEWYGTSWKPPKLEHPHGVDP